MLKRLSASILTTALLAAACSEPSTAPSRTTEQPAPDSPPALLAELTCTADVAAQRLSCGAPAPTLNRAISADLILGGQNTYVTLANTAPAVYGTDSLTAEVTVKNLTVQPWATTDGTTATSSGVRVFFHTLPNNGVTVDNADGTQTYTATNQPYFQYAQDTLGADAILSSGETSVAKHWRFALNGASSFTFQVYIVTNTPDEQGVLRWTGTTLSEAATTEIRNTVWGTSSSDVWTGGTAGNTSLQHWDGASWTTMAGAETADVTGLWGTSSTNVYAVGGTYAQRWDGVSWTDVPTDATSGLLAIWGSSATDIYAGGLNGMLVHSSGGNFTAVSGTGLNTNYTAAIWGTSASDVYIGGTAVRHWDGTSWSAVSAGITNVQAIWGSSATDIWIGGSLGKMVHWNGSAWSNVSGFGSGDISGIWGRASNDVYMVNRAGEIWHYNGSSWVKYSLTSTVLLSVWGSGRQDVWAAGTDNLFGDNLIYHGTR
jgi:hypothetical protein